MDKSKQVEATIKKADRCMVFNQTSEFMTLLKPDGIVIQINQIALNCSGVNSTKVMGDPLFPAHKRLR